MSYHILSPSQSESGEYRRDGPGIHMVPMHSACLFLAGEVRVAVKKNHTDMVKFASSADITYVTVVRRMRECLKEFSTIKYVKDRTGMRYTNLLHLLIQTLTGPCENIETVGIKGFEEYLQSLCIATHQPANLSSSSIRRADYIQFFNRQEFKRWLSDGAGIFWLSGPRGSGKTHIAKYLKLNLGACDPGMLIVEYTCSSCLLESTISAFCRAFLEQLFDQLHYSPSRGAGLGTLNINGIVDTVRRVPEYSQNRLSELEMTLFIKGIENAGRQPDEQKEFLLNILNLFRQMVTTQLFKTTRFLLISQWDLGIQTKVDTVDLKVNSIHFDSERAGLFLGPSLGCFDEILTQLPQNVSMRCMSPTMMLGVHSYRPPMLAH